ncbi:ArnT family glycosyltransferase [Candidatus Omnitrophota bacterium]
MRWLRGENNPFFFLAILWLVNLSSIFIWLKRDINYLTHDSHRHFLASLRLFEVLKNLSFDAVPASLDTIRLHPPFVMMITAPFFFLFGTGQDAAVLVNSAIFLGILIFSIYGIGTKIADRNTGLLAAFIICTYPVIHNQLKVFMLDLPLTSMLTLSIYFLLSCDNFKNIKNTVLFSISAGLGMLTKDSFLLYLSAPLGFMIITSIFRVRKKGGEFKKIFKHFLLPGALFLSICSFYYFNKFFIVLTKASYHKVITWPVVIPESGPFLNMLRALLWYFWGFINWQVSLFFFLVFVIAVFFFAKAKIKNKGIFFFWIFSSWILVSLFRHAIGINMKVTGVRYTMPILPAVAVISAFGITQIPAKKIRFFLTYSIIIFGILQLFFVSYPIPIKGFPKKVSLSINLPERIDRYKLFPEGIILFNFGEWAISGRDSGSYSRDAGNYLEANKRIFDLIDSSSGEQERISVLVIPDNARLRFLQYMAYLEKKDFSIVCDWNYLRSEMAVKKIGISELIQNADYVIDKSRGHLGEPYMQPLVKSAKEYFDFYKERFIFLRQIEWPDRSAILIYKKLN